MSAPLLPSVEKLSKAASSEKLLAAFACVTVLVVLGVVLYSLRDQENTDATGIRN